MKYKEQVLQQLNLLFLFLFFVNDKLIMKLLVGAEIAVKYYIAPSKTGLFVFFKPITGKTSQSNMRLNRIPSHVYHVTKVKTRFLIGPYVTLILALSLQNKMK